MCGSAPRKLYIYSHIPQRRASYPSKCAWETNGLQTNKSLYKRRTFQVIKHAWDQYVLILPVVSSCDSCDDAKTIYFNFGVSLARHNSTWRAFIAPLEDTIQKGLNGGCIDGRHSEEDHERLKEGEEQNLVISTVQRPSCLGQPSYISPANGKDMQWHCTPSSKSNQFHIVWNFYFAINLLLFDRLSRASLLAEGDLSPGCTQPEIAALPSNNISYSIIFVMSVESPDRRSRKWVQATNWFRWIRF